MDRLKSDINAERARLQRDNSRLQDLVSEMRLKSNAEVESFKTEMERMAEESEREVEQAREEVKRGSLAKARMYLPLLTLKIDS